ncbi:hypothetical protein QYF36_010058 [Acer negundo]|nr:hypothetical protein QYF36_010058 [Acer negundo]
MGGCSFLVSVSKCGGCDAGIGGPWEPVVSVVFGSRWVSPPCRPVLAPYMMWLPVLTQQMSAYFPDFNFFRSLLGSALPVIYTIPSSAFMV